MNDSFKPQLNYANIDICIQIDKIEAAICNIKLTYKIS